jgi:hypothetical protein
MKNGRLLRHFEAHYYSRIPHGRLRRFGRLARLLFGIATDRELIRTRPRALEQKGWSRRSLRTAQRLAARRD